MDSRIILTFSCGVNLLLCGYFASNSAQEIEYAKTCGKRIVLLADIGVKIPSMLQDTTEYMANNKTITDYDLVQLNAIHDLYKYGSFQIGEFFPSTISMDPGTMPDFFQQDKESADSKGIISINLRGLT